MNKLPVTTAGSLVLAVVSTLHAQEKQAPASPAPPPAQPKPSAGLLNEYLRGLSPSLDPFDFGGQFRVRYELKDNGGVTGATDFQKEGVDNDNSYVLFREKIHLGYHHEWFQVFAEARDSREAGDDRQPSPERDVFDLHQGFLVVGNAKEFPLTGKVGRQELVYGDERLVGTGDWGNLGRVFDGVKLRYESPSFWVDGFTARLVLPDDGQFNMSNDYDQFSGVYASTRTLIPGQESQLYFLARNAGAKAATAQTGSITPLPSARDIYTLGARVKSLPGQYRGWDYGAELAGQLGSIKRGGPTTDRLDHQAWAASAGGGYTWTEAFAQPRVGLEYNFASGDRDVTDNDSGTFEQLFPTNHKHYGYMDFVGWRNIHNPRLMASARPHQKVVVSLDYHLFWLADTADSFYTESGARRGGTTQTLGTGYGINPGQDSFVGSELDLDVTYNFRSFAALRTGYGHFFTGSYVDDSFAAVGGSTDANWFYVQLVLNF